MGGAIQRYDSGVHGMVLRVRSQQNNETDTTHTSLDFLNKDGERLNANAALYTALRSLVPVFSLKTTRDGSEFNPASKYWGPIVRSRDMNPDTEKALETELADLNQKIVDQHESFGAIKNQMSKLAELIPLAGEGPANVDAIPRRILDVLSRTQITLASVTGASIPLRHHGEGTQSLAVICLFEAFRRDKMSKVYTEYATPILTLEEPEAHLHPSAAYSVVDMLQDAVGQSIITTHSGDLVSGVPIESLRRLRRAGSSIQVYRFNKSEFEPPELGTISHYIQATRGNLFFARCWLLVEGVADRIVFDRCAAICGNNFNRAGVYCLEYSQIPGGLKTLIRLAEQFGIEWLLVADGDRAGDEYVKAAGERVDRICQLEYFDLEHALCASGYGDIYLERPDDIGNYTRETWGQVKIKCKPYKAVIVTRRIAEAGPNAVPEWTRKITSRAVQLARGAQ